MAATRLLRLTIISALAVGLTAGDFAARDLLKNREYNSWGDVRQAYEDVRQAYASDADDSGAAGSAQRHSYLPRGGRSAPREGRQQRQRLRVSRRQPQSQRQSQEGRFDDFALNSDFGGNFNSPNQFESQRPDYSDFGASDFGSGGGSSGGGYGSRPASNYKRPAAPKRDGAEYDRRGNRLKYQKPGYNLDRRSYEVDDTSDRLEQQVSPQDIYAEDEEVFRKRGKQETQQQENRQRRYQQQQEQERYQQQEQQRYQQQQEQQRYQQQQEQQRYQQEEENQGRRRFVDLEKQSVIESVDDLKRSPINFGPGPAQTTSGSSESRYKPASGPAYAPSAEEVLGGPDFDPADFPQLGAQDRSYDSADGLAFPVVEGPGSAQSRDLQAQVLQHAAGFKPDGVYQTEERLEFQIHGQKGPHSYRWGYDTGNGYNRQFRYEERDDKGYVRGRYGFFDRYGKLKVVNYSADPYKGFHAEGAHIH